jgi:hypothetical protein
MPVADVDMCDQCWRMLGGTAAITAKLEALAADCDGDVAKMLEQLTKQPLFVLDPAAEALLCSVTEYDHLHPLDRILVESGIRWTLLRHVVPAARIDLALRITDRTPPPDTRPADAPVLWFECVEQRIRDCFGGEFKYRCKLRRWWYIARVWAMYGAKSGRPLSCVTQAEVAAVVGCSDRTVRRCARWLQQEGLLFEVVPGCQMPMMTVPEGATPAERADRDRALTEATAAEETARQRARAELAAVRSGLRGDAAAQAGQAAADEASAASGVTDVDEDQAQPLLNIAPVYELRVPWTPAEQAEARSAAAAAAVVLSEGEKVLQEHKASLVHELNAHLYGTVTVVHANGAHRTGDGWGLTSNWAPDSGRPCRECGPVVGLLRHDPLGADLHKHENGHPPVGDLAKKLISSTDGVVDKRRATRGIDHEEGRDPGNGPDLAVEAQTEVPASDLPSKPVSEPVRLAQRLKNSRLDRRVTAGVSVSQLAREISASGLLDHDWNEDDLVDHLHGYPEYRLLPMEIRNPGGWIHARLSQANPHLSPRKLHIIDEIEHSSTLLQQRHQTEQEAARQAEIDTRRAAIDGCQFCDELGWIEAIQPTARCNHDSSTGGW